MALLLHCRRTARAPTVADPSLRSPLAPHLVARPPGPSAFLETLQQTGHLGSQRVQNEVSRVEQRVRARHQARQMEQTSPSHAASSLSSPQYAYTSPAQPTGRHPYSSPQPAYSPVQLSSVDRRQQLAADYSRIEARVRARQPVTISCCPPLHPACHSNSIHV